MERYDIAIIGTGPAGVSAALTAKNRNKTILLLGSRQMSEKVAKAHEIRNYPGLPFVKGEALAEACDQCFQMLPEDAPVQTKAALCLAYPDYKYPTQCEFDEATENYPERQDSPSA